MKLILPLLILVVLLVGCSQSQSSTISDDLPSISEYDDGGKKSLPVIEPPIEQPLPSLRITNAEVIEIRPNSAILTWETNRISTATVTLITSEREVAQYIVDYKIKTHTLYMGGLKHSALYYVVIEAVGSDSYKKVIKFNTNTPIEILYSYTGGGSYSGLWFPPTAPTGTITASWLDGDGTFINALWSVSLYPNETKQCRFTINNQTGSTKSVIVDVTGNQDDITISNVALSVPHSQQGILVINCNAHGDAPPGLYTFTLEFMGE